MREHTWTASHDRRADAWTSRLLFVGFASPNAEFASRKTTIILSGVGGKKREKGEGGGGIMPGGDEKDGCYPPKLFSRSFRILRNIVCVSLVISVVLKGGIG